MKAFVVFFSGLLMAAPVFAQGSSEVSTGNGGGASAERSAAQEDSSTSSEGEGGDRRICRRIETASGSRMSYRRLCMTADQWRTFNRRS